MILGQNAISLKDKDGVHLINNYAPATLPYAVPAASAAFEQGEEGMQPAQISRAPHRCRRLRPSQHQPAGGGLHRGGREGGLVCKASCKVAGREQGGSWRVGSAAAPFCPALAPTYQQRGPERSAHCRQGGEGCKGGRSNIMQVGGCGTSGSWGGWPGLQACRRRSASTATRSPDPPQCNAAQEGAQEQRAPHGGRGGGLPACKSGCKPLGRVERMVLEALQRPLL